MYTMRRGKACVGLLLLCACGITGPDCTEKRQVVEVMHDWTQEASERILAIYVDDGWDCRTDGAIRDASGATIGTRWVCSRCD
jgi:hypothetical protein